MKQIHLIELTFYKLSRLHFIFSPQVYPFMFYLMCKALYGIQGYFKWIKKAAQKDRFLIKHLVENTDGNPIPIPTYSYTFIFLPGERVFPIS